MIYWLFTAGQNILGLALVPCLILALSLPVAYCWKAGIGIQHDQQYPTPGRWSGRLGALRIGALLFPDLAVFILFTRFGHDFAVGPAQGRPAAVNVLTQLFIGAPASINQGKLTTACLMIALLIFVLDVMLHQAIRSGGGLHEAIDRMRRPDPKRGEMGSAHLCSSCEFQRFLREAPDLRQRGVTLLGAFWGENRIRLDQGRGKLCRSAEDMSRGALVIGRPGTGKTQGHILPAIADGMNLGHSLIVVDPQDELTRHVLNYARVTGHLVAIHDPTSKTGARYNLTDKITNVSEARTIAAVLVPPAGGDNQFWANSATDLLAACLIRFANLGEIKIALADMEKLKQVFSGAADDAAVLAGGFIAGMSGDGRVASSIVSTLSTALSAWSSAEVRESTSTSDFDADLLTKRPTVIILKCPGENLKAYAPYLGAVLSKLILNLDTLAKRNTLAGEEGRLPIPVELILEEFYTLGYLEIIVKNINLVRKRRIGILIAIQTIGQLREVYGQAGTETLLAGCAFQTVYGSCDHETADFYSKVSGITTVGTPNPDPSKASFRQRPLLTSDEITTPQDGISTMFIAYSQGNYAGQIILHAQPTFMYQRTDWAERIRTAPATPFVLKRGIAFTPKMPTAAQSSAPVPAVTTHAEQPQAGATAKKVSAIRPLSRKMRFLTSLDDIGGQPAKSNLQIGD